MANLKVTIKESINLNNTSYGGTRSVIYSDIVDVYKRILTLTANVEINLYTTADAKTEGSVMDSSSVKYVRITNLESSTAINVQITQGSNTGVTWLKVLAGDSLILGNHSLSMDAASSSLTLDENNLGDITKVNASASGADTTARVELFIASTANEA
jgi:hypothetical protein